MYLVVQGIIDRVHGEVYVGPKDHHSSFDDD